MTQLDRITQNDFEESLTQLREVMGVMQHHDAITGTEKQAVANDYARLLKKAMDAAETNVDQIVV